MNVYLTFDVEVWCNDWKRLDERFPSAFERYYFGHSKYGDYALPKTLEILNRHQLRGVFFVEPLFAARFGIRHLRTVVDLIQQAGQKVELHLHPEWTDEITPAPIANVAQKRQHLTYYSLDEQSKLIHLGLQLLAEAGARNVSAFRAGSFACNRDTFRALRTAGMTVDSSRNAYYAISGADLGPLRAHAAPTPIDSVWSYPVANFYDGLHRLRSSQLSGCGFDELREAMRLACIQGWTDFVIVSHNFEMLKAASTTPDFIVVHRFEKLCAYLQAQRDTLTTQDWTTTGSPRSARDCLALPRAVDDAWALPHVGLQSSSVRLIEQAIRRF